MRFFFVPLLLTVWLPLLGHGKEEKKTPVAPNKNSFFTMRYAGYRYELTSDTRNMLVGNAIQAQLGYGKLQEHSFWEAGASLLVGPLSNNPDLPLPSTNQGVGIYTTVGWVTSDLPIRSENGPAIGMQCGLSYMNMTQKSIKASSAQGRAAPYVGSISDRSMRVSDLSIYPGFFVSWLPTKPRPDVIHPDSIKTRIEGYWLQIGVGIPLYARYNERYLDSGVPASSPTEELPQQQYKGALTGYTVTASFTVVLGV